MFYLLYWLNFLIVFFAILIAVLIVKQVNLSNIRKQQEELNKKVDILLQNAKFKQTKVFFLNDHATHDQDNSCKKHISIDNKNKKICLIDYTKGSLLIVGFNEILNYEIYENGSQQIEGGNIGGLWSGLFGAETNGMCKDLKLIIRLKRYDISQVCYEIISNTNFNIGINKSTPVYKQCVNTLQEVVSFLEVVKNENSTKKPNGIN